MSDKKKQVRKIRYTDEELSLIKNTFAENEDLLKALRKFFLQFPLELLETHMLDSVRKNKEILAVVRKTYLPTIDTDAPLHQVVDLWMTVDIKDKSPHEALPHLEARKRLINYLDQQLNALEKGNYSPEKAEIRFDSLIEMDGKDVADIYSDISMRNTLISHNEQMASQLAVLAGSKEETVEQTQKRLQQDSSR